MNAAELAASRTPRDTALADLSNPSAAATADAAGKRGWLSLVGWIVALAVLGAAWRGADMRPLDLLSDSGNMGQFAKDFFPPDFGDWRIYVQELLVTLAVAVWGTVLAVVCAIPCGLLSARNMAPVWVVQPVRRVMDACRAINEMVFAMLFIVAVGLGPFAGVLALWVHTTGVLAKLFAEAVEAIDPRPAEGVRATGATGLDEIIYAVLPQVLPLWISYVLYRFESNVRSAMVVGMVGAGGIGVVLYEAIRSFNYAQTAAVMIMVIVVVTAIDLVSAWLRERVI
ncbi:MULTISPECIES: phosphonate ABC transporter, permease protein PhnE [Paraburkholderia]|uniref:phosphonate ABC transporter, permease protein PhnE n=1 Tax=Paraburkholderia TaxID=1822464 RepID=UPI00225B630E|nr:MULTISPECIES: phosphonate ABC transporter, permease protein PhnE [Paraburkholderia]MCX4162410.1 phosphonate ABC transporter, permease protein PhnE [Paraburkholderia megapolitana]MDN7157905.1 phosphonate ABC transporter, permease protein PhnE [Paraburkholderia sp. CHISQ3]MDQ6494952.1 phosphonate ABC transporter, permease protein PhnE [Paraburkholderia megapolitana]